MPPIFSLFWLTTTNASKALRHHSLHKQWFAPINTQSAQPHLNPVDKMPLIPFQLRAISNHPIDGLHLLNVAHIWEYIPTKLYLIEPPPDSNHWHTHRHQFATLLTESNRPQQTDQPLMATNPVHRPRLHALLVSMRGPFAKKQDS